MVARCYSADDPEQLRGPEFDHVWADEIAKWRYVAAWDNLMLALRAGRSPRALATTTPRPAAWLAALAEAPGTVLVQGSSGENRANLAAGYLPAMEARFGGTAIASQELDGVLTLDAADALFQRATLIACRGDPPPRRHFVRMVIGVDPAIGGADETGIITVGKTADGTIWVLADDTIKAPADKWLARLVAVYRRWRADKIIAEVNQGGDLICTLLAQSGIRLPVRALYPAFRGFHPARQAALISMAFNLGKPRLAGFRRMRAVINRGDWGNAAAEAEASLWARQTRRRADEIARLLRAPDTA